MTTVVVDYGWGNLQSVVQATRAAAPDGMQVLRSSSPDDVKRADRLIVPGQGAFRDASLSLHRTALGESILEKMRAGTPYFGICMGLQILFEDSEESGLTGIRVVQGLRQEARPRAQHQDPAHGLELAHPQ